MVGDTKDVTKLSTYHMNKVDFAEAKADGVGRSYERREDSAYSAKRVEELCSKAQEQLKGAGVTFDDAAKALENGGNKYPNLAVCAQFLGEKASKEK